MHILFISTTIPSIYIYIIYPYVIIVVVKSSEVPIFWWFSAVLNPIHLGNFHGAAGGHGCQELLEKELELRQVPQLHFFASPMEPSELEKLVFWASKRRDCNIQHGENEVLRCSKISDGMVYCPRFGPGHILMGKTGAPPFEWVFESNQPWDLNQLPRGLHILADSTSWIWRVTGYSQLLVPYGVNNAGHFAKHAASLSSIIEMLPRPRNNANLASLAMRICLKP